MKSSRNFLFYYTDPTRNRNAAKKLRQCQIFFHLDKTWCMIESCLSPSLQFSLIFLGFVPIGFLVGLVYCFTSKHRIQLCMPFVHPLICRFLRKIHGNSNDYSFLPAQRQFKFYHNSCLVM